MAEVYRHLDDPLHPAQASGKAGGRPGDAELSYDLATIRCNAPIDFTPQEAMLQEPNKKELYDLFVKLEFVKLIDRYKLREAAPEPEPQQVAVQLPHRQELPEAGTPCALVLGRTAPWPWLGQKGVCAVPPLEREGRLEALLGPETPKSAMTSKPASMIWRPWGCLRRGSGLIRPWPPMI